MALSHPNIVHVDDLPGKASAYKDKFAVTHRPLSGNAGGRQLGCSHYTVPPGKSAFQCHFHWGNEEAIHILAGEGTLRLGEQRIPVRAGHYIALPAGGPGHQLLNTGTQDLVYLCLSTNVLHDVVEYPDTGKVATYVRERDADGRTPYRVNALYRKGSAVDYLDGE